MLFKLFLFSTVLLISCAKNEEVYLYDKNDPDYLALENLAMDRCLSQSTASVTMQRRFDLSNFRPDGKVYTIRKTRGTSSVQYYLKILSLEKVVTDDSPEEEIETLRIAVKVNGLDTDAASGMIWKFSQLDNRLAQETIMQGVCLQSKYYKTSDMNSSERFRFAHQRRVTTRNTAGQEAYDEVIEQFDFNYEIPLIFNLVNSSAEYRHKEFSGPVGSPEILRSSFSEVANPSSCGSFCDFSDVSGLTPYDVAIDEKAYEKTGLEEKIWGLLATE